MNRRHCNRSSALFFFRCWWSIQVSRWRWWWMGLAYFIMENSAQCSMFFILTNGAKQWIEPKHSASKEQSKKKCDKQFNPLNPLNYSRPTKMKIENWAEFTFQSSFNNSMAVAGPSLSPSSFVVVQYQIHGIISTIHRSMLFVLDNCIKGKALMMLVDNSTPTIHLGLKSSCVWRCRCGVLLCGRHSHWKCQNYTVIWQTKAMSHRMSWTIDRELCIRALK